MTVTEALEKLKSYEQTSFALRHAMGLLYYDGVTAAPKGAAAVRGDTTGELSRIDYQLTTAADTVEMLETLMAAREELDSVTRRKVEEYWRDYDRTRRIPEEEFVAYQRLSIKADDVWQTAKETNDFALFEPYLQEMFDTLKRFALYWEPDKAPYETLLDNYERGLTTAACDTFFAALRQKLVPLIQKVTAHADRVDDTPLRADFPIPIQREFSDFVMDVMGIDREPLHHRRDGAPLHHQLLPRRCAHHHPLPRRHGGLVPVLRGARGRPRPVRAAHRPGAGPQQSGQRRVHGHPREPVPVL